MSNNQTATDDKKATEISATPGKFKLMIVDDEADARVLFAELLATNPNYEVEAAADGTEALEKAAKQKFDLILLDIVMPKKDGIETLTEMIADKAKYGEPTVIMLTNIGGDVAIEKALELGAAGYKLKIDTEPEELLKYVEEVLQKRSQGGQDKSIITVFSKNTLD